MVADKKLTAIVSADDKIPASSKQAVSNVDGQQLPPGYIYDDEDGEPQTRSLAALSVCDA